MEQTLFLEKLIQLLDRSALLYQQYLNGGRTFQWARELKRCNNEALQLLKENKSLLPEDMQGDVEPLITHYTAWTLKWEQLAAEKEFGPDDEFVFANDVTFPKQAARNIESTYKELTQQPATPQKK